jgi:hypothetical protein
MESWIAVSAYNDKRRTGYKSTLQQLRLRRLKTMAESVNEDTATR